MKLGDMSGYNDFDHVKLFLKPVANQIEYDVREKVDMRTWDIVFRQTNIIDESVLDRPLDTEF